ncbi:MAG: GxxExxY protein [Planctomycetota bacterium]|jgi:GxxExxY protein
MKKDLNQLTESIIKCAFEVSNKLGVGFLEKVYENAMVVELQKRKISVQQQHPIKIFYDEVSIGEYFADLFIENEIIVELKVAKAIDNTHQAQLLNYLKATNLQLGLLLNFSKQKVEIKRMSNNYLRLSASI